MNEEHVSSISRLLKFLEERMKGEVKDSGRHEKN
jgi:hypothetical protein